MGRRRGRGLDWAASSRGMRPPRWTGSSRRRLPASRWVVTPHRRLQRAGVEGDLDYGGVGRRSRSDHCRLVDRPHVGRPPKVRHMPRCRGGIALVVICAVLGNAGCSDSGRAGRPASLPSDTAPSTTGVPEASPDVDGVASAFVDGTPRDGGETFAGTARLVGCRWRSPGRLTYDLEWHPPAGLDLPVTLPLEVGQYVSDVVNGRTGLVTLTSSGTFSITQTSIRTGTGEGKERGAGDGVPATTASHLPTSARPARKAAPPPPATSTRSGCSSRGSRSRCGSPPGSPPG